MRTYALLQERMCFVATGVVKGQIKQGQKLVLAEGLYL